MKKVFGILLLTLCVSLSVLAKDFKSVCASHILVPTEMDAIKIKSQIKSYDDFKNGPWLSKKAMEWFCESYSPEKTLWETYYISPIKATEDVLADLPPALIITDENDVLRDEGEAYARKLDMAGVNVICCRINGTIHDFMVLNALYDTVQTQCAIDLACSAIKNALK